MPYILRKYSNSLFCIPNPEPHNPAQRWLNMPFFEFLLSRLQPGGQITLASNIPEDIEEAQQQLIDIWKLPFRQRTHCRDFSTYTL